MNIKDVTDDETKLINRYKLIIVAILLLFFCEPIASQAPFTSTIYKCSYLFSSLKQCIHL